MQFLTNAVRIARKKRGWTQSDLAKKMAVTQGTISFWENQVEIPSLDHQLRLIELMPDMLTALAIQELHVLDRLQALERIVFEGKCACEGCDCSSEDEVEMISQKVKS